jgi:hypothetical protein
MQPEVVHPGKILWQTGGDLVMVEVSVSFA